MGITSTKLTSQNYTILQKQEWNRDKCFGVIELVQSRTYPYNNGELYKISVESVELQKQILIYQFRKDNSQYFVTVHSVNIFESQSMLCGKQNNKENVEIILQRIPFRLSDLKNIPLSQAIYILQTVFEAAQVINQNYSVNNSSKSDYINYVQDSICFNESGQAKLWVNPILACNSPLRTTLFQFNAQEAQNKICNQFFSLILPKISEQNDQLTKIYHQTSKNLNNIQKCLNFIKSFRNQNSSCTIKIKNISFQYGNLSRQLVNESNLYKTGDTQQFKQFKQSRCTQNDQSFAHNRNKNTNQKIVKISVLSNSSSELKVFSPQPNFIGQQSRESIESMPINKYSRFYQDKNVVLQNRLHRPVQSDGLYCVFSQKKTINIHNPIIKFNTGPIQKDQFISPTKIIPNVFFQHSHKIHNLPSILIKNIPKIREQAPFQSKKEKKITNKIVEQKYISSCQSNKTIPFEVSVKNYKNHFSTQKPMQFTKISQQVQNMSLNISKIELESRKITSQELKVEFIPIIRKIISIEDIRKIQNQIKKDNNMEEIKQDDLQPNSLQSKQIQQTKLQEGSKIEDNATQIFMENQKLQKRVSQILNRRFLADIF